MKHLSGFISVLLLLSHGVFVHAKPFSLELDINGGYNNNVFLTSDDLLINEEEDDSSKTDVQNQMAATASVEVWDGENSDATIMLDYFRETLMENDADTTITMFSLPMNYYFDKQKVGVSLSRQSYNLSGVDVLNYSTGRFSFGHKIKDRRLAVAYSYTKKDPQADDYVDYDGNSQVLDFSIRDANPRAKIYWLFSVFDNNYEGDGLSNNGRSIKAAVSKRHGKHSDGIAVKYKLTNYELSILDLEAREDRQLSFSYNHDYYLNSVLQLYFDASYIHNSSNVDYDDENYNYDQWVNTLGARFVF